MTHVTSNVVQQSFRARNDDGSESAATWIATANTNWSQDVDTPFRVRFLIEETAGGSANNYSYLLQYNINGTGWVTQSTTGAVHSTASAFVADATPTTQQLGAGAFVAGEFDSDAGASNISLTSQQTEMEYCLLIDSTLVSNGDTIQLRVTNNGAVLEGYTNTPTITVVEEVVTNANLSAQEVGDDAASVTTTSEISGGLSATEVGNDSSSISGSVDVVGSLSSQELGSDTTNIEIVQQQDIELSLATQEEGSDVASATTDVVVATALSSQEVGNDSVAISATITDPALFMILDATEVGSDSSSILLDNIVGVAPTIVEEGQDTASSSITSDITVTPNIVEQGEDSVVSSVSVEVASSLSATEVGADTTGISLTITDPALFVNLNTQEQGSDAASVTTTSPVAMSIPLQEEGSDTTNVEIHPLVSGNISSQEAGADSTSVILNVSEVVRNLSLSSQEVGSDSLSTSVNVISGNNLSAQEVGEDSTGITGNVVIESVVSPNESGQDLSLTTIEAHIQSSLAGQEQGKDVAAYSYTVIDSIDALIDIIESGKDTSGIILVGQERLVIRRGVITIDNKKIGFSIGGERRVIKTNIPLSKVTVNPPRRYGREQ